MNKLEFEVHDVVYSPSVWTRCSQPSGGLQVVGSAEDAVVKYLPETAATPGDWDRERQDKIFSVNNTLT